MNHAHLFDFESDFVSSLRCVPMAVRLKLDRVLIKLSLRQWSRFTVADRQVLLATPCRTPREILIYRAMLVELVAARSGEAATPLASPPAPTWEDRAPPEDVVAYARSVGVDPPGPQAWEALDHLQRFALVKLSRDNHDNVNFLPAMCEFGLLADRVPVNARRRARSNAA